MLFFFKGPSFASLHGGKCYKWWESLCHRTSEQVLGEEESRGRKERLREASVFSISPIEMDFGLRILSTHEYWPVLFQIQASATSEESQR